MAETETSKPRRWEQFKRPARRGRNNSKDYIRQREVEIIRLQQAGFTRKQIGELLDPPMSEVGVKSAIRQIRKRAAGDHNGGTRHE